MVVTKKKTIRRQSRKKNLNPNLNLNKRKKKMNKTRMQSNYLKMINTNPTTRKGIGWD